MAKREDAHERVFMAAKDLERIMPSAEFLSAMGSSEFESAVNQMKRILEKHGLSAEDLWQRVSPHPGDLIVDWAEIHLAPERQGVAMLDEYVRLLAEKYRNFRPLMLPEHEKQFRHVVSRHIVENLLFEPDYSAYEELRRSLERHHLDLMDSLHEVLLLHHRGMAVDDLFYGDVATASRRIAFLHRVFGNNLHKIDARVPDERGKRGYIRRLAAQLLLAAKRDGLALDPGTVRELELVTRGQ